MKQGRMQEVHNTIVSARRMKSTPAIIGGRRGKREGAGGVILNTMYGHKIQECKKGMFSKDG